MVRGGKWVLCVGLFATCALGVALAADDGDTVRSAKYSVVVDAHDLQNRLDSLQNEPLAIE